MVDQFYTPATVAKALLLHLPQKFLPSIVADFSAGDGSLLFPAFARWPQSVFVGNDLSLQAVKFLVAKYPSWIVTNHDFHLQRTCRGIRSPLDDLFGGVDLVLCNPPFSQPCRRLVSVPFFGEELRAGNAVAFIARTLLYMANDGVFLGVVPDGALHSHRDRRAWSQIEDLFEVEILEELSPMTFYGARARTSLLRIVRRAKIRTAVEALPNSNVAKLALTRGRVQVHSVRLSRRGDAVPFVHTSSLRAGLVREDHQAKTIAAAVAGPALLFPRVGRVTQDKIGILQSAQKVVLSDCLISLACESIEQASARRRMIISQWHDFATAYRGTGAPFITMDRAHQILMKILAGELRYASGHVAAPA